MIIIVRLIWLFVHQFYDFKLFAPFIKRRCPVAVQRFIEGDERREEEIKSPFREFARRKSRLLPHARATQLLYRNGERNDHAGNAILGQQLL